MSLAPGTLIGPYEIQALVGAGGMGEVYRATDTKLGRDVAIKILPAELAADSGRSARFGREARTLASLNHPHIATLYGWEPLDGAVGHTGATMLVMELVEGPSLESKLARGALPLPEVVRIGSQIADALAAAHEQGIVHRDLKPANIKLTRSGAVKVLDFGIAKAVDDALTAGTVTATGAAQILGTPAYMSPEQARGQTVDARADVWAFGCVLVEMLTGRRPFDGATTSDVLAAVLTRDPDWSLVSANTPAGLRLLIQRCLQKEIGERFRSMADARMILADVGSGSVVTTPAVQRRSVPALLPATVAALVVASALAAWGWMTRSSAAAGAPVEPPQWQRLTFREGYVHDARFAADGQTIVYAAAWDGDPIRLFSTTTVSPESRALDLPPAGLFSISSTGRLLISLGCRFNPPNTTCPGTLAQAPLLGGAPRALAENVTSADWGTEENIALVQRQAVEYPIGTRLADRGNGRLRTSPDGKRLAWTETVPETSTITVMVRDGIGPRALSPGWGNVSALAWSSEGSLYVSGRSPTASLQDEIRRIDPDGSARVVVRSGDRLRALDVDRHGSLLVDRATGSANISIKNLDDPQSAVRDLSWLSFSIADALSRDGKTMLFTERASGYVIYMRSTDGGPAQRLGGPGYGHAISDDGRWALTSTRAASSELVLYPLGPGTSRALDRAGLTVFSPGNALFHADFVDASRVIFRARKGNDPWRTYVQPIDGGAPELLAHEPGFIAAPVSPDGTKFVSERSDGSLWIASVTPGEAVPVRKQLASYEVLEWTADGRGFFIARREIDRATIVRLDLASGRETAVTEVLPSRHAGFDRFFARGFFITPDGRTLVTTESRNVSSLFLVGRP